MGIKVTYWTKAETPSEPQLRDYFQHEGLRPYAWTNGPFDYYPTHDHHYDKVIYVLHGSITWIIPGTGQELETFPGDRLDLPAGTPHAARVGAQGVTCLEAHRD